MAEIKLYGTLVNMTSDQKIAYARQLYDELINKFQEAINEDIYNKLRISDTSIEDINTILSNLIVDNLDSNDGTKGLSARQGKVLKSLVEAIHSFSIIVLNEGEELPVVGESNTLYFKKKTGSSNDVYDEYIYVNSGWELIGTTQIDLNDYYTKAEVDTIKTQIESKIPTIPDIEVSTTGQGNVITSVDVDNNNKHKLIVNKELDVYSKQQVDDKLSGAGLGDVTAAEAFKTADRVITSNGPGKTVKDSGVLIGNLALKSELTWESIKSKPGTFPPSAHTHVLANITDAGALAGKDKVDESDLNFNIPDGVVVDSALSDTSENPVQNKVITAQLNNKVNNSTLSNYVKTVDLNTTLGDYYLKTETYTKSEVDDKIGSAGGGDVMTSGNLVENNIILGAGPKSIKDSGTSFTDIALKSEIPSLDDYTTKTFISNNYYPKDETYTQAEIDEKIGSVGGDNYYPTGFSWTPGATDGPTGSLTGSGMSAVTFPAIPKASTTTSGIVTTTTQTFSGEKTFSAGIRFSNNSSIIVDGNDVFNVTTGSGISFNIDSGNSIRINDEKVINIIDTLVDEDRFVFTGTAAVANKVKNGLSITAGGTTNVYTGSTAISINLDNIFNLPSASEAGAPGIFVGTDAAYTVDTVQVTATNPDAVIVVPSATTVTFGSSYQKMAGLDDLSGGTYKCYCISRISSDIILVNGTIYG